MASSAPVAIVTGGNSGMGIGIVEQLVKRGWKVAVADIQENKDLATKLGDASSFHNCNVADYDRFVGAYRNVIMILIVRNLKSSGDVPTGLEQVWTHRCFVRQCRDRGQKVSLSLSPVAEHN